MADRALLCEHCREKTMSYQLLGGLQSDDIRQSVLAMDPFPDLQGVLKKALCEERSRDDQTPFRVSRKDSQIHRMQNMADRALLCEHCREKTMSYQLLGGLQSDDIRQSVLAMDPFPDLQGVLKKALCEERSRDNQTPFRVSRKDSQINKMQSGRKKSSSGFGKDRLGPE
eukprot:maker-scaffold3765_size7559-snap-gene-0.2 protein:Tk09789 transcript:maker-scaffold3765_size7559-snap-gene-0.2-mRNA-1 annotation:"hypothetical protein DAPPUDRAFT_261497"